MELVAWTRDSGTYRHAHMARRLLKIRCLRPPVFGAFTLIWFAKKGIAMCFTNAPRERHGGIVSARGAARLAGLTVAVLVVVASPGSARADLLAAYVQGYGGLSSVHLDGASGQRTGNSTALGVQAGARLLGLEAYGDYASFGGGAAVQRGILGLRLGMDVRRTRLELRFGGGFISEFGGALTGAVNAPNRKGVVGRVGFTLENQIAEALLIGFGVTAESFALDNAAPFSAGGVMGDGAWIRGSDVFASLHLKFEVGI